MEVDAFFTQDLKEWIFSHGGVHLGTPNTIPITFHVTLWWIWRSRNVKVMENIHWTTAYIMKEISCMMTDLGPLDPSTSTQEQVKLVRWLSPTREVYKLNWDGSSLGNPGKAAMGGLLRNEHGVWIGGYMGFIGYTTNIQAELEALRCGLVIAWGKGLKKLEINVNCQDFISLVSGTTQPFHIYRILIRDIICLLKRDWDVKLCHVYQKANQCTDKLAKHAARVGCHIKELQDPSSWLMLELEMDGDLKISYLPGFLTGS